MQSLVASLVCSLATQRITSEEHILEPPGFCAQCARVALARRPATRWKITSKTGLSAYSRAIFPIRRRLTHLMQEQTSPSHRDPLILLIADDLAITKRSAWESSCRPRFVIPT